MENRRKFLKYCFVALGSCVAMPSWALKLNRKKKESSQISLGKKERCPVCGMFVKPYPKWITQMQFKDKSHHSFDGMKCFAKFYFNPEQYDHTKNKADFDALWVRDYYTLHFIRHDHAHYVVGSDVLGPMGHELIPFKDKKSAEIFFNDHHGVQIVPFERITPALLVKLDNARKTIRLEDLQ
ncbi:MAG: nitrous oxide reductase accessory protein NosL [SAR324 cluster bacterium]|nr:nitrous oxide reductase accessory protein NosL [SAR324 cluster bacterium]